MRRRACVHKGPIRSSGRVDFFACLFRGRGVCERETFLLGACVHNMGSSDHQTGCTFFALLFRGRGACEREMVLRRACMRERPSGRVDVCLFLLEYERESFLLFDGNCAGTTVVWKFNTRWSRTECENIITMSSYFEPTTDRASCVLLLSYI